MYQVTALESSRHSCCLAPSICISLDKGQEEGISGRVQTFWSKIGPTMPNLANWLMEGFLYGPNILFTTAISMLKQLELEQLNLTGIPNTPRRWILRSASQRHPTLIKAAGLKGSYLEMRCIEVLSNITVCNYVSIVRFSVCVTKH